MRASSASASRRLGANARAIGAKDASRRERGSRRAVAPARALAGRGDSYYAGKGKYIKDDRGLVSKTGRDNLYTGGFAGGEKGLWSYREELVQKDALAALKKMKKPRKETREVSLSKDFGGLAGGFPGGEIGVKSFNATGEIPQPKLATLGWGPPVLATLTVVCGYTYYTEGELSAEALQRTASTLVAKLSEVSTSAPVDESSADGASAVMGAVVDLVPDVVKDAATTAAIIALGLLFGGIAVRAAFKKAVKEFGRSIKIIALAAVSGTIALKILHIW